MTTRGGDATLRVGANISGALSALSQLQDRARSVGRSINNVSGGSIGAVGRAGVGVGNIVGAGFGLQAGFAVFEQLVERIFELFEDTPVLEKFTEAIDAIFKAMAPLIEVLLLAFIPILQELLPVIEELVPAFIPLIRALGDSLLLALQLLLPLVVEAAPLIESFALAIEHVVGVLRDVAEFLGLIGPQTNEDGLETSTGGPIDIPLNPERNRAVNEFFDRLDNLDIESSPRIGSFDIFEALGIERRDRIAESLGLERFDISENIGVSGGVSDPPSQRAESITVELEVILDGDTVEQSIRRANIRDDETGVE